MNSFGEQLALEVTSISFDAIKPDEPVQVTLKGQFKNVDPSMITHPNGAIIFEG